jgi:hypothetical protein
MVEKGMAGQGVGLWMVIFGCLLIGIGAVVGWGLSPSIGSKCAGLGFCISVCGCVAILEGY